MGSSTPYFYAPLINRRLCKIAHRKAGSSDRAAAARVVPELMHAGGKMIEVVKVRVTAAGREAYLEATNKSRISLPYQYGNSEILRCGSTSNHGSHC